MVFIAWINEIFTEPQAPYTLKEITARLQQMYDPAISYSRVHHALAQLSKNAATAETVKPLDPNERYHLYSCEAARRIARKVTNSRPPAHLVPSDAQIAQSKKKSVLKSKPNRTLVKTPLAPRRGRRHH